MDFFCKSFLTQLFHFFFFFMLHCERLFSQKLREVEFLSFNYPNQCVSGCSIKFHYQSFKCPYIHMYWRDCLRGERILLGVHRDFTKIFHSFIIGYFIFSHMQVLKWVHRSSPAHPYYVLMTKFWLSLQLLSQFGLYEDVNFSGLHRHEWCKGRASFLILKLDRLTQSCLCTIENKKQPEQLFSLFSTGAAVRSIC